MTFPGTEPPEDRDGQPGVLPVAGGNGLPAAGANGEEPGPPAAGDDGLPGAGDLPAGRDSGVPAEGGDSGVPAEGGDSGVPAEGGDSGVSAEDGDEGPGLPASLESILLVADEPVAEVVLAQVLERPRHEVAAALEQLASSYDEQGRGFELRRVAGGWRFYTREECAPVVERFVRDGQEVRLTQAALETLAVVAYQQPVSRARVSAVRGVNCDGVIRTLTLRGLVEEAGTDGETGAILYRTSGYFLERLGLPSLDDLPELAPFLPELEDADETEAADDISAARPAGLAVDGGPAGPAGDSADAAGYGDAADVAETGAAADGWEAPDTGVTADYGDAADADERAEP